MKTRIISGAIIALVFIGMVVLGGVCFDIGIGLLAICATYELMNVKLKGKPFIPKVFGMIAMLLVLYGNIKNNGILIFGLNYRIIALNLLLLFIPTLFSKKRNYTTDDAIYMFGISTFIGVVFSLIIGIFNESVALLIYLVLISCITDSFALIGGMLIGNHKLTSISPKKTIEGSVCGTIFALIICTTMYYTFISNESLIYPLMISLILSVVNQLGDLFFSLIKRENDIKDYSKLIPGHGGILDRLDSLIFVVLAYVVITFI